MNEARGNLFIVSAPSGAGKTSLLAAALEREPGLLASVSYTTRPPRPGEEDGRHYHFVSESRFQEMVGAGEFLEHARVFGNFYGTSEQAVREQLRSGKDVVLEIDWQGARQVRKSFPQAVTVFILPPSIAALRERLSGRGQDAAGVIEARMRRAQDEMRHYVEFDYLVFNDDFDRAVAAFLTLVRASRLRRELQAQGHRQRLSELLAGKQNSA